MKDKETKFHGCFIDESELYSYNIEWNGELVAKARTMSAKDKSIIERASMTKSFIGGKYSVDVDSNLYKVQTIKQALTSWELPRPITEENISLLTEEMRTHLYAAIEAHETQINEAVETTEKN